MESIAITRRASQYLVSTSKDPSGKGKTAITAAEAAAVAVQKSQMFASYVIIGPDEVMKYIPTQIRSK